MYWYWISPWLSFPAEGKFVWPTTKVDAISMVLLTFSIIKWSYFVIKNRSAQQIFWWTVSCNVCNDTDTIFTPRYKENVRFAETKIALEVCLMLGRGMATGRFRKFSLHAFHFHTKAIGMMCERVCDFGILKVTRGVSKWCSSYIWHNMWSDDDILMWSDDDILMWSDDDISRYEFAVFESRWALSDCVRHETRTSRLWWSPLGM